MYYLHKNESYCLGILTVAEVPQGTINSVAVRPGIDQNDSLGVILYMAPGCRHNDRNFFRNALTYNK